MNNIRKILVPTDFSTASEKALDYTINFVKEDKSIEVTILHIVSNHGGRTREEMETKLQATKERFHSSLIKDCHWAIKSGPIISEITNAQVEFSSDMIIMGTQGSHTDVLKDVTNTSELVLEADCPVLVIPENKKVFSINNIALALGKDEIDDSSPLGVLHDIAMGFHANVHLLTINSNGDHETTTNDTNEGILEYFLEAVTYYHAFPQNSDMEQGILDYVKEKDIDMLAILPRNHAKKSNPSEGRLTKLLTLHSEVPVLTID